MKHISFIKYLYKKITIDYLEKDQIKINGFLVSKLLKLKTGSIIWLTSSHFLIKKNFLRTFFSILFNTIDGICYGFKNVLYLRGKGLRFQLKYSQNCFLLYLKLGYSHKILFTLPSNMWLKIKERRRQIILYSFDYCQLRSFICKIKNYYRLSLYKLRGFIEPNEIHRLKKGNLS